MFTVCTPVFTAHCLKLGRVTAHTFCNFFWFFKQNSNGAFSTTIDPISIILVSRNIYSSSSVDCAYLLLRKIHLGVCIILMNSRINPKMNFYRKRHFEYFDDFRGRNISREYIFINKRYAQSTELEQ